MREVEFDRLNDETGALRLRLVDRACEESYNIRRRLAVVAEELRQAATTAGTMGESLLALAAKFEQNATAGDQQ